MAHTIEEMREAKAALCKEIADKLGAFEQEYGVMIETASYIHGEARTSDVFGHIIVYKEPRFAFDVKL